MSESEMLRSGAQSGAGGEDGMGSRERVGLGVGALCIALLARLLLTPSGKMGLSSFSSEVPL